MQGLYLSGSLPQPASMRWLFSMHGGHMWLPVISGRFGLVPLSLLRAVSDALVGACYWLGCHALLSSTVRRIIMHS